MLLVSGTALADDGETGATSSTRPTDTMVGTWTIDGKEYVTTDATEFDEGAPVRWRSMRAPKSATTGNNDADVVDTMRTLPAGQVRP
ncbi:MAG: hypothetical protein R3A10_11410 [Caldilineaceae bacterium]